jgi:hypothetical protein
MEIESVPDLLGFAAANGHEGKTENEIRAELGNKFPKHIYHSTSRRISGCFLGRLVGVFSYPFKSVA